MNDTILTDSFRLKPNEDVLACILDGFEIGVAVCDVTVAGFPILQVSETFTAITSYDMDDAVGRPLCVLEGADTNPATWESLNRALAEGSPYRGELLLYCKDGNVRWCEAATVQSPGTPTRAALGIRDISARREWEERLQDDRAVCRGMFDNAVGGIYRSTVDGHYVEVNPALARMYGYNEPEELMSQVSDISNQIYVDPTYRDLFKREIEKTGVVRGLEYQVRRRDGGIIWISERARVVRDIKGAVRYYEGFIDDITSRKEAEQKLRASQQQLLETSRQVGMAEVATSILHNMGNALNSINTSISVATEKVRKSKIASVPRVALLMRTHSADLGGFFTNDPRAQKIPDYLKELSDHLIHEQSAVLHELDTLRKSVDHLNGIVAMQQSYAKGACLEETVSVVELIDDALRMTANSLARHGVQVIQEYSPVLPEITVPKHKILQILLNLVRNAEKACDTITQNKQLKIRATGTRGDKWVRMEVVDNGIGIPHSNLTLIFSHGFTTRKDGHGFGLHSCALMAKEMGGVLTAHSEGPGRGASFILEIPCQPNEEEPNAQCPHQGVPQNI